MNVYRRMAKDYSEFAFRAAIEMRLYVNIAKNRAFPFSGRVSAIRNAKNAKRLVIAYAEQVEFHLQQAIEKENT